MYHRSSPANSPKPAYTSSLASSVRHEEHRPLHQAVRVALSPLLGGGAFSSAPAQPESGHRRRNSISSKHRRTRRDLLWQRTSTVLHSRNAIWAGLLIFTVIYYMFFRNEPAKPRENKSPAPRESQTRANDTVKPVIIERERVVTVYQTDPATASCSPCILDPADPLCVYGVDNVRLSRSYEGSGHRVRKVLEKALRGEEVTIGVLGASVTTGHGLNPGEPKWQDVFVNDFRKMFPKTKIFNGAAAGMNSAFFAYCYGALVPETLDMYLIELDVNNDPTEQTFREDDSLYRGLLGLPQKPAVVRVQVFALIFPELARGAISTSIMSQYHDVPVIGIRNWLLPRTSLLFIDAFTQTDTVVRVDLIAHRDLAPGFFAKFGDGTPDTRHITARGHKAVGDMIAIYMREQTCESKRRKTVSPKRPGKGWPQADILEEPSPQQYLWTSFNAKEPVLRINPSCDLASSTLRPLEPIKTEPPTTFKYVEWNDKHVWMADHVGANVTFRFRGTRVGLFLWSHDGKHAAEKPGIAYCYLDGRRDGGSHANAWVDDAFAHSRFTLLFEDLAPTDHTMTCEILEMTTSGGHDFRILGIGAQ